MAEQRSNKRAKGHDSPVESREFDDYDRWPVASTISNVIRTSPVEWSTRVGLYGRWGQGKTTVLNLLESQQRKERNIVIRFSPWGATTEALLWREFAKTLKDGLRGAGIAFGVKATALHQGKKWSNAISSLWRSSGRLIDRALPVPGASVLTEATASMIERFLGFGKLDIVDLIAQVGDRRVVVFIDDVDRADPSIIPRLLLALRELLDLPKFVFVLAFDKYVVCPALGQYNIAWGKSGEAFLEKIVDFPFELPPPDRKHIEALARRHFGELGDFFPLETIDEVAALLPGNPRRLKLLARVTASLGPEARRHEREELDWTSILIFQMLRLESEDFTRQLISKILDDKEFSWMRWAMTQEAEQEEEARFTQFVSEYFDTDEARRERVRLLVNAWRKKRAFHAGERLRYQISFSDRPHHITWGEFKEVFARWRATPVREIFDKFVSVQANRLESTSEAVAIELVDTVLLHYGTTLERASEIRSQQRHTELIADASAALTLCDQLLTGGIADVPAEKLQRTEVFVRLLHTTNNWIHFRANPGEPELREKEASQLTQWCTHWSAPLALFGHTQPWSEHDGGLNEGVDDLRKGLRERLHGVLWPRVIAEALALFEKVNGVSSVVPHDRNEELYYTLSAPDSELYNERGIDQIVEVLRNAPNSVIIQENAVRYLQLLVAALENGGRYCSRDERIGFLGQHGDLVAAVWQAAVARPSQYRFLKSLRDYRAKLVAANVPEALLASPDWLLREYEGP